MTIRSDDRPHVLLAGASLTGLRHTLENSCNQDALLFREYPFGCVLAVADGVGSDKYSQYGSASVVNGVHVAFSALAGNSIRSAQLVDSIVREYRNGIPEEYLNQASTTCLYAAHIYGMGIFLGQIGDGICCGKLNGQDFILQSKPDDFTNIVIPLSAIRSTSEWTEAFIQESELRSFTVMLATDGVSEDILPGRACGFADLVADRLAALEPAGREHFLLNMLRDWATPKSIDDKTFCFYAIRKAGE